MKKVMHLMSTHDFSGAENVACQIINAFKEDYRYEMLYVSEIDGNKGSLIDREIKYYRLDKFNYFNVKKSIQKFKPDIIHAHDAKAIILASFFSNTAKIVAHIHGNHENMRCLTSKTILLN
ncbi:hypothetical protein GMC37_12300, partial [Turicibacter sanguinis]|nr:hypothetical protein [Turicibacter sanguinis]